MADAESFREIEKSGWSAKAGHYDGLLGQVTSDAGQGADLLETRGWDDLACGVIVA